MSNRDIVHALTKAGWDIHDLATIVLDHISSQDPSSSGLIIEVDNLKKSYGPVQALAGVSLFVKAGTVTALLGPNGAGKTTLIRVLTTLLKPDSGMVRVAGLDAIKDDQALRARIGLAGQYAAIDETLTGRENLELVGRLYHLSPEVSRKRADELLHQFDLVDAGNRSAKTYSGGMRRRLDLAASLVNKPALLFLDEPTTGLDPRSRLALWRIIKDLVAAGTTVLLTTQYLEEADQLADHVMVIDHGRVIEQGTTKELKNKVGGDVLEIHLDDHQHVYKAAPLIKHLGDSEPRINEEDGTVAIPVKKGSVVLIDAVRILDDAQLKISDIVLRRPTLDDVFLSLTGHRAEDIK
ncbi:ATP-binding cassette domain-containing protein [Candidatus Parcubacteria bacterium]|nr:ATP-binding cassette domain-containing protein [Candidatus Parcubacteria bacterium]